MERTGRIRTLQTPIDLIEDFSEDHMASAVSMAAAGCSSKHPCTRLDEDSVDLVALLDRAADRFSECMDTDDRLFSLAESTTAAQEVVPPLRLTTADQLETTVVAAAHRPRYSLLPFWRSRSGAGSETGTHMV